MGRVLVTGTCGRIGPYVVPLLAPKFDLVLTDWRPVDNPPFPIHRVNLLDFDQTCEMVRGVDSIVHLAIASSRNYKEDGVGFSEAEQEMERQFHTETIDVNVKGTYHLFEAARRAGVRRIVYASSLTISLGSAERSRVGEETVSPSNVYACTKLFGEHLGDLYWRKHRLSVICLRLGQPFPLGHPLEKGWARQPQMRGIFVAMEDIAFAIEKSLLAPTISFGVYNIVSEADSPYISIAAAKRDLGYVPTRFCNDKGEMVANPRPATNA